MLKTLKRKFRDYLYHLFELFFLLMIYQDHQYEHNNDEKL